MTCRYRSIRNAYHHKVAVNNRHHLLEQSSRERSQLQYSQHQLWQKLPEYVGSIIDSGNLVLLISLTFFFRFISSKHFLLESLLLDATERRPLNLPVRMHSIRDLFRHSKLSCKWYCSPMFQDAVGGWIWKKVGRWLQNLYRSSVCGHSDHKNEYVARLDTLISPTPILLIVMAWRQLWSGRLGKGLPKTNN